MVLGGGLQQGGDATALGLSGTDLVTLRREPNLPAPSRHDAGLFHTAILFPTQAELAATVLSGLYEVGEGIDAVASLSAALDRVRREATAAIASGRTVLVRDCDYAREIDPAWLDGVRTVGLTSGASVPEVLVRGVIDFLADHGFADLQPVTTANETLVFALPREIRKARV